MSRLSVATTRAHTVQVGRAVVFLAPLHLRP